MARADILNVLYSKDKSPLEFKFDSLWLPPMYNFISPQDVQALYRIATSAKLNSKIEVKYSIIHDIMTRIGFKKLGAGTNRVVYAYLEDTSFVAKIAIDDIGISDNPREYKNQFILKPFVTKVFEVSPCGVIGFFERVEPIQSRPEFESMAGDVYELLTNFIIGKYVLDDIGTKFFMNWGVRTGFGPCLLDFPYVYELDGNKMHCTHLMIPNNPMSICDGEIDYDTGFNHLRCSKCGKAYFSHDLQQNDNGEKLIIIRGENEMRVRIVSTNGDVVCDPGVSSDYIKPKEREEDNIVYSSGSPRISGLAKYNERMGYTQPKPQFTPRREERQPNSVREVIVHPTTQPDVLIPNRTNDINYIQKQPEVQKPLQPQEVKVELVDRANIRNVKISEDDTIKVTIYTLLRIAMNNYPFEKDDAPNMDQRSNMYNHLYEAYQAFIAKSTMLNIEDDPEIVIYSYIDANYTFEDRKTESSEGLEQFGLSDKDFEDPSFEKIKKSSNRETDSVMDLY